MDIFNCVDLKRHQVLSVLVDQGVDLENPNTFIIDEFEGITGDWSDVTVNLSYLEDGETMEFGIDQQGFAAKMLTVKKVNNAFVYGLYDENGQTLNTADMIDIDDTTDTEHDCTVTLDEGEHYHVYELGTFTLDEGERLLQALGELPITHNRIEASNFNEIEYAWNTHDLTCVDLLTMIQLCGLIVDYTFKLK